MPRIRPIDINEADNRARKLLARLEQKYGRVPNLFRTMAHSPAALEGHARLGSALARGRLDGMLREQIALAVAQANRCDYCLASHTAAAKHIGLSAPDIMAARDASSSDARVDAALKFARRVVDFRAHVTDAELQAVRDAGFDDGEIAEIVANVVLNIFTDYINHVAETEVDFPKAESLVEVAGQ